MTRGAPGPLGARSQPGASPRGQAGGGLRRAKFVAGAAGAAGIRASPRRRAEQGRPQGTRPRPRAYPPDAFTSGRLCPASADFPAEGRRQVPREPGGPSRRGGGQWGAGPPRRPPVRPRAPRTAPSGRASARGRRGGALPSGPRPRAGPAAREREGWLSVLQMGGGGQNTRTVWLMTGGRWRGGGVERKTPGLNRGIKKGGRKGKSWLRSWACWRGVFACGAQGTESPPWPRPRVSGRFLRRKRSKVSRAALQGRRAPLLHADGLRGCPSAPRGPNTAGRCSLSPPRASSPSPTAARGCSSKPLLSLRHWDLVSSLESLVNLRSGSWPPSGTADPQSFSKSLSLERFVLQECTPGNINTEMQRQGRASSEIPTPKCAPPFLPHPPTPAPRAKRRPCRPHTAESQDAWESRAGGDPH